MTSMLPAIVGAVTGVGLYIAFDVYYLSGRRRAGSVTRQIDRG